MLSKKNRKDLNAVFLVTGLTFLVLLIFDKFFNVHRAVVPEDSSIKLEPKRVSIPVPSVTNDPIIAVKSDPILISPVSADPPKVVESFLPQTVESIPVTSGESSNQRGLFGSDIVCPAAVHNKYSSPDETSTFESDLAWCKERVKRDRVSVGKSWGSMTKAQQMKWDKVKCNEIIMKGKLQTCDQRWGWGSFDEWLKNSKSVIEGASTVTCASNIKTSTFCQHGNVMLDFSNAIVRQNQRVFNEGFINTYGCKKKNSHYYPHLPGTKHNVLEGDKLASFNLEDVCEVVETRPTFLVSNDDIFNLGHYYNDLMGTWNMVVLANRNFSGSVLLNMDGFREYGPAGGPNHRLMLAADPDNHGPYVGYYNSWFGELKKARDYGKKKVCFKEIYFPPVPGVPWFWNDWGQLNDCSAQAASPLYQSYNLFMRQQWREKYGNSSLALPPKDVVHVVIEVRAINKNKMNNHSSARHIKNLAALIKALESIPNVKVTAQDFAKLPFAEQVSLSHSASIFISMHGAGTTHIFHSALGEPNCCALVELFPDETIEFYTAHGYGNIARMLGMHHYRVVAPKGTTTSEGTRVSVEHIKNQVEKAVQAVTKQPTCLHDVKDSRSEVYGDSSVFQPVK